MTEFSPNVLLFTGCQSVFSGKQKLSITVCQTDLEQHEGE